MIRFTLDGAEVEAEDGETLWQVSKRLGNTLPHLCHTDRPGFAPEGNCRACVVEIKGERALAASCRRTPSPGMVVISRGERVEKARKLVFELLLADHASPDPDSAFKRWAGQVGVTKSRFAPTAAPIRLDASHPAMAVRLDACIHCTLCLRACREVQVNDVIGMSGRGAESRITFDFNDPMGASSCVGCGECVQACPTGALLPAGGPVKAERSVDSLCPYCGVGCQVTYHVTGDEIIAATGRDGLANHERLCVKGRFGFDYSRHPQRLTVPLIRKEGAPKELIDPADPFTHFRPATWDEALDFAAAGLKRLPKESLAGLGSAKGSNEEAYLFQKLVRTGFKSNNVDHCTRLCHASSVAALLEGIGSGAVTAPVAEVANAEVIILIGANPSANHPVAASFIKNAVKKGARLVILDPRGQALTRFASHHLKFNNGTDVALLNALLHVIVAEELYDKDFVAARTIGFAELAAHLDAYSPEAMAPVCGIDAGAIRAVARLYARAASAMILWGMGVSQHSHGTDNSRCLIALALLCGQVGKAGSGLHPLRGQNNVQGASDAGLIPMMLPDYGRVGMEAARGRFEAGWGLALDSVPGLTVVEMMKAAEKGEIRGMYVEGENPAMSDPDLAHARGALAGLDHLVVQDIFLTETAMLADVVLPASSFFEKTGTFTNTDRHVQLGRQVIDPPGEARPDLWIIAEMARRLGLPWSYDGPKAVFDEMRGLMGSLAGITWDRLEGEGGITYPAGKAILFDDAFPTETGKARLVPASGLAPAEVPDAAFPFLLSTGRVLEHWHTGSMTRRSGVLDTLQGVPAVNVSPVDMARLGLDEGAMVRLESRRGSIQAVAAADSRLEPGALFMPFCFTEAAANLLTNPVLDPVAKIPELKVSAVRLYAL
ncbi:Formate dehydrogenase subunit alpha(Molybdopterin oxidoreductase,266-697;Molydopterin dinucleotide-binding domain,777-881) [Magnetospirillum sp. XM-1]|uniref:formate dehydrogenase subunit alpha n=1 Tax=Magnetospirillum sp. XM-1 TaxID=1663591 RepID=UPI00073DB820|nr:formate dehydrogenase subunit alpha [Magnetospirillum sp. XM-1]CUW38134.1 Formate dehydrogenase subunit alpha(Molybdopterin oxidoreductase,266-697;Molydopterin dinucleotide-binding domain,777-881) [Magnetospirillum sp. XM-1]